MADLEECLALFQGDAASIPVIGIGKLGTQIQLGTAAILQHDQPCGGIGVVSLVSVRQPALMPADVSGNRQRQGNDRCRCGQLYPAATAARSNEIVRGSLDLGHRCRVERFDLPGDIPDLEHGVVFDHMQGMGLQPLLECLSLCGGTVFGMQAHAPMRSGIGDRIVFCLAEKRVAHGRSGLYLRRILPLDFREREYLQAITHQRAAYFLVNASCSH